VKNGMNIVSLNYIPLPDIEIPYHPRYEDGGRANFWVGRDNRAIWCKVLKHAILILFLIQKTRTWPHAICI